jgi:hypothetical protein
MTIFTKKQLFAFLSLGILSISVAEAAAQVLIKNEKNQPMSAALIPPAIWDEIKVLQNKKDHIYKIVVQKKKKNYVLYLLSNQYWKATKIRINVSNGKIQSFTNSFTQDNDDDDDPDEQPGVCPDNSIEFVAISAYPGIGKVNEALKEIAAAAVKNNYKTITLLGEEADAQVYKNWLSCANLKGFYSIGHGTNEELLVGNGEVVSYRFFEQETFNNKYNKTTLLINSCQVFNYPLGSELTFGNAFTISQHKASPGPHAYEYIGGYNNLAIGDSELISACFFKQALSGKDMNYKTLKECVGTKDFYYKSFGISHPGRKM